jgi:hypothetical protein
VGKAFGHGIVAALAMAILAVPVAAQDFSDGYNFIKAVKDRDATKATDLVSHPGTTVINSRERSTGEGALHILVRGRDLDWLSFMIGKGAKLDLQNNGGETPLSIAAQLGWTAGAELLLTYGAGVDVPNQRGETPLIFAVRQRDLAMVRLLLRGGANPKKTDHVAGYSALDYAKQDSRGAPLLKLLEAQRTTPRGAVAGPKL